MFFWLFSFNKAERDILGPWACYLYRVEYNLRVIFDFSLKFDKQIKTVFKNCFFYQRAIAKLKVFLLNQ